MDKRVMLAVAGAGKTYYICHVIDKEKRNLILAYTHENINNIVKELIDAHGSIPKRTTVMTFDSFLYRCLVCPYEPTIGEFFGRQGFKSKGITMKKPPEPREKSGNRYIYNPLYKKKSELEHYITKDGRYYCANLAELIMNIKKGRESLIKRLAIRLDLFYDQILIDEFQDFRKHNYDLIVNLSKLVKNIILVGDYYQHSVAAKNNSGKPFEKCKTYSTFFEELENLKFQVDNITLQKSRRCSKTICEFVKEKLEINIESEGIYEGIVKWVDEDELDKVLNDKRIVKLLYSKANDFSFNALNWSYSKGDTLDSVCVVLTEDFEDMDRDDFSVAKISPVTRNKLYVALTRSKGNLYLIKASQFKKCKIKYMN